MSRRRRALSLRRGTVRCGRVGTLLDCDHSACASAMMLSASGRRWRSGSRNLLWQNEQRLHPADAFDREVSALIEDATYAFQMYAMLLCILCIRFRSMCAGSTGM